MTKQNKTLFLSGQGGSFSVESTDVASPGPGYVLVEVRAAGLNPLDYFVRDSGLGINKWPTMLGADAARIVTVVGEGVTNVTVGDRV